MFCVVLEMCHASQLLIFWKKTQPLQFSLLPSPSSTTIFSSLFKGRGLWLKPLWSEKFFGVFLSLVMPLRFLKRVQDWPIFMSFQWHTKPNWVWDQFYQPLEITTLTWLNGLKNNWNHFLWTSILLLMRLNLLTWHTGLLWRDGPFYQCTFKWGY